ncbi:uncharacterized protein METZ01_LOCUS309888, partial [marine metagenome]
ARGLRGPAAGLLPRRRHPLHFQRLDREVVGVAHAHTGGVGRTVRGSGARLRCRLVGSAPGRSPLRLRLAKMAGPV